MRILAALLAAGLLVGCLPSSNAITGRTWRLVQIDGAVPAAEAGISFGVDGRVAVSPGCNSGGGAFSIEGNRITVGELLLTAMACGDPADAQEQAFLAVLGASPRFEIETRTGRMRLTAGEDALVFETP
jgi:heat shock protein HslJ